MAPPHGADPGSRSAFPRTLPPGHPEAAAPLSTWSVTAPASGTAAWLVRKQLTAWLTTLRWPLPAVEDVVFAVNEAVSNSIEHAYPPDTPGAAVEISAAVETTAARQSVDDDEPSLVDEQQPGRRLRILVRDHGTWRPVPPDPSHRGRGLQMMMAMMSEVVIHHSDDGEPGTDVVLISPVVALHPPA